MCLKMTAVSVFAGGFVKRTEKRRKYDGLSGLIEAFELLGSIGGNVRMGINLL